MSTHESGPETESNQPAILTEESIAEATGFKLAVTFPRWQTDGAGIISFHDELERLGKRCGWDKVIGSLYYENDQLLLGIFIDKDSIPQHED